MRIPEPIETRGFFWLPGKPKNEVPGILRISESGEIELETLGLLRDFRAVIEDHGMVVKSPVEYGKPNLDRIVGIVEKGRSVTLDGCIPRHKQFDTSLSKSLIRADFAFIGRQYDTEEEISFSKLEFSVDGLDEWLAISGFDAQLGWLDSQNIESFNIHYKCPDDISLVLPDEIGLNFTFNYKFIWGAHPVTEAEITQKAYISLSLTGPQPVECFFSLMSKICNFLSFAVDQAVSIDSITGYLLGDEALNAEQPQVPVNVYGEIGHHSEKKPGIRLHRMLFAHENIGDYLEQVLARWLESYEKFEPAFNLYFASRSGDVRYQEVRFLLLVQGIEVLHRRSYQETSMPEGEFGDLRNIILEAVPDDKRDWMKGKLEYANEISLRKRIKQMVAPFKDLMGTGRERNHFINKVVDTRNYLTHYDSDSSNKAASGQELWHLYQKLEALFQLHLIQLMGVHADSIRSIVSDNEALRSKIGLNRGDSYRGSFTEIDAPSPPSPS